MLLIWEIEEDTPKYNYYGIPLERMNDCEVKK